jgi:electron transfer flavoprotein alpha/beta subunit
MLFGCGANGKIALEFLNEREINVKHFVDNDKSKYGQIIDGVNVISLEEALQIPESVYVITIGDDVAFHSIKEQLLAANVPANYICRLGEY